MQQEYGMTDLKLAGSAGRTATLAGTTVVAVAIRPMVGCLLGEVTPYSTGWETGDHMWGRVENFSQKSPKPL